MRPPRPDAAIALGLALLALAALSAAQCPTRLDAYGGPVTSTKELTCVSASSALRVYCRGEAGETCDPNGFAACASRSGARLEPIRVEGPHAAVGSTSDPMVPLACAASIPNPVLLYDSEIGAFFGNPDASCSNVRDALPDYAACTASRCAGAVPAGRVPACACPGEGNYRGCDGACGSLAAWRNVQGYGQVCCPADPSWTPKSYVARAGSTAYGCCPVGAGPVAVDGAPAGRYACCPEGSTAAIEVTYEEGGRNVTRIACADARVGASAPLRAPPSAWPFPGSPAAPAPNPSNSGWRLFPSLGDARTLRDLGAPAACVAYARDRGAAWVEWIASTRACVLHTASPRYREAIPSNSTAARPPDAWLFVAGGLSGVPLAPEGGGPGGFDPYEIPSSAAPAFEAPIPAAGLCGALAVALLLALL